MARKKKRDADEAGFPGEAPPQRVRLTPVDVQQKVFRIAFRGYNERDVDAFLDQVTEELAALHEENKRLREGGGGATASGGVEDAQRQAEEIVRQAREHAARLIEDAEQGGATVGGLPTSFLLGERAFLQRLASSVQEHARWLKQEARRTQGAAPAPEQPAGKRKSKAKAERPPQPEPRPEPEPAPEPPPPAVQEPPSLAAPAAVAGAAAAADQTAAWGPPQEGMAEPSPGWGPQEAPPSESDPLLSAWESAFTDSGGPAPQPAPGSEQEGEPSLRELFWGEE